MSAILSTELPPLSDSLRATLGELWLADESECVEALIQEAALPAVEVETILSVAERMVRAVRSRAEQQSALDAFMRQYDLSSEEGVLLMCVAEALLRIPDADTADRLIQDKLGDADWESHLGKSPSLFVNASTWGLMLTGKLVNLAEDTTRNFRGALRRMVARSGEPVIRSAVRQAMKIMGHQFVMGRTIAEALKRSRNADNRAYRHSFDMLGEAALTAADAARYLEAYSVAIRAIGAAGPYPDVFAAPSISVKLSALHPRYEFAKRERVLTELVPAVAGLARLAREQGIALTVDAEEADRLELSLEVFAAVFDEPALQGWPGLGLALQAYQKRAPRVIDWLAELARRGGRRIPVRLVKGAYWDSEIKRCQEQGLSGYPVFTRKVSTDLSYLACARRLLAQAKAFYPQFATHNAHTIAAIHRMAGSQPFEFQRLHGMGADLYAEVISADKLDRPCRIYAPVGSHEDLLPYLVRRLLENGANTSFVNRITDESLPVRELVADPVAQVAALPGKPHPRIPLPAGIYGSDRRNSRGVNLADPRELAKLAEGMAAAPKLYAAAPIGPGLSPGGAAVDVTEPADRRRAVGHWRPAQASDVQQALATARTAQAEWDRMRGGHRATILERAAELMEARSAEFIGLAVREAGKTIPDAVAELREAVDFLRYYAARGREGFAEPVTLPGPTGESNQLSLHGRGVFVCISPWNFPLAIFTGQVAAALMAGNSVIAKPAEQTTLIAALATRLLIEAGVPEGVLQLLPGDGATVGAALCADPRVAGVAFTGSTETARLINRGLAERDGPLATLIAETGGQNVLIADSSALPEQLVKDALASAFGSAGQRCSALRVLCVQEDIAERVIAMLAGAMDELVIGDPGRLSTDIGPVIDAEALAILEAHAARMRSEATVIRELALPAHCAEGSFFAPRAYAIRSLAQLEREVFGPVLHVLRYRARDIDALIDSVNALGYGLTLGIHSRLDSTVEYISHRMRVGNCYVNRNMIGAVVGVQPFGGEGLSGTGPKAGGPHYLARFATERTLTINTAAVGGNASLLALGD